MNKYGKKIKWLVFIVVIVFLSRCFCIPRERSAVILVDPCEEVIPLIALQSIEGVALHSNRASIYDKMAEILERYNEWKLIPKEKFKNAVTDVSLYFIGELDQSKAEKIRELLDVKIIIIAERTGNRSGILRVLDVEKWTFILDQDLFLAPPKRDSDYVLTLQMCDLLVPHCILEKLRDGRTHTRKYLKLEIEKD